MRKMAWDRAEENQWGELEVPFDPVPDQDWLEAFASAVAVHESEPRGQQWKGILVYAGGIIVAGLEEDGREALQSYTEELVRVADCRMPRNA